MTKISVSVIGSFRKYYGEVAKAVKEFEDCGIFVKSPPLSVVVNPGAEFPRFESDDPGMSNRKIQELTMEKILTSDIVYVVAPRGYVGRTTCYEIGMIRERGVPLYFSDRPIDLPIHVSSDMVLSARDLANTVSGTVGTTS
jgi:hypothetical protein